MLTGTVAAQNSGPAVVLSFVIAGLASVFAASVLCRVRVAGPDGGSAYTYGYATLGEFIAWIIGWDLRPRVRAGRGDRGDRLVGLRCVAFSMTSGIDIPGEAQRGARQLRSLLADGTTVTAIFNLPAVHHHRDRYRTCSWSASRSRPTSTT